MLPMAPFQEPSFNRSFSQLAKESCFTFNLYRGRVDWRKLEMVDVDRIVRDQDVEMLNIHLSNITNCNLESEYDVKILDPNFIKLFKLAQLLIDFLLHCKTYLEHCVKVAHDIIQSSNKEVEGLRNQLHARKTEVKQLKTKIKEIKLQLQHSWISPSRNFKCSLCGKVFMSDEFLESHRSRRHGDHLPDARVLKPLNPSAPPCAQQNACNYEKVEPPGNAEVINIRKKYQEEIEEMKRLFFAEIEKLKPTDTKKCSSKSGDVQDDFRDVATSEADKENQHQDQQSANDASKAISKTTEAKVIPAQSSTIITLPNLTKEVKANSEKEVDKREEQWSERLELRESIWRTRLADLDQQYQRQVSTLHDRLAKAHDESQEIKTKLEQRLEEVMNKFEKCQAIASKKQTEQGRSGDERDEAVIQSSTRIKNEHPTTQPHESEEKSSPQPPPFQKRRAFVSQKTKTIQETSVDTPNEKENRNDLVRMLDPEEDSDLEVIPIESQRTGLKSDNPNSTVTDTPSRTEESVRSKTQENYLVRKVLEEEKIKDSNRKLMFDMASFEDDQEEEESSVSETYTESESDITEEDKQSLAGENPQLKHGPADWKSKEKQLIGSAPSDSQVISAETELAEQSLQSMERVLAANPGILGQLRGDLERLVGRRLQNLGVDPGWTSLPPATFENKMAVLRHQRQITAKNHKVFFTLRDKLDAAANAAVHDRPAPTSAQSLVARLRGRVANVTRRLSNFKNQAEKRPAQPSLSVNNTPVPLSSSSPHDPGQKFNLPAASSVAIGRSQESPDSVSLSLSSTESDDGREEEESVPVKSALRNAVSTGNLAKKKVLFVDQPITEEKRSLSDNTVATSSNSSRVTNTSVSSLVDRIQQQLGRRGEKPAAGVDLMRSAPASFPLELPLSELLPLSKSGRELLESEAKMQTPPLASSSGSSAPSRMPSPRTLEPLSHMLKKVPVYRPPPAVRKASHAPQTAANKSLSGSFPQAEKTSPSLSLSSLGSSLLYNTAVASPKKADESLDLDLQDLEDNLRF